MTGETPTIIPPTQYEAIDAIYQFAKLETIKGKMVESMVNIGSVYFAT